ncbi:LPXTG cell wall anchor domain-containing protein [Enterococcus mundtii]|uniref:LPXTG cell wall anchor domain-containing protein n=1 Tax=Enterococcus mundtii TaxID=53346 RepID=UPI0013779565|nr:LPXTG cell wall anchor domain-containing protein [Enterococcus mundtii]NBA63724.1 LPXTG cell wall anchor domain-containing protein [Enterococcus mundtii]
MKCREWLVTSCLLVLFTLDTPYCVNASSIQVTETESSIQFTGVYEPMGIPDPPPSNIVKPAIGGELPQTNTKIQNHWIWLGWLFIGLVVIAGIKKISRTKK